MSSTSVKSRLNSTGFFTNLTNLFFIAAAALGVTFGVTGEETVQAFIAKNYEMIFQLVIPSVIALGFKIVEGIKQKVDFWKEIVKSPNFWNLTITTVLSAVTVFLPIAFPADAGENIYNAVQSTQLFSIITVVVTNVITPIWYYLRERNKQTT